MRQLTESVLGFSWALSLFGAQQAARLLAAPLEPRLAGEAGRAFDSVAWRAQVGLGPTLQEVFQAGDSLQRDAVDLSFAALPRDLCAPEEWLASGGEILSEGADTARLWSLAGDRCLAWRDLANKVEVYVLVKEVGRVIGVPGRDEPFVLPELVERAYALEPYPALWAVEGLGHDYVQRSWRPGERVTGLLTDPEGLGIPAKSLLMLHAGLGLGFAQPLIGGLPYGGPAPQVARVVGEVVDLCRESSLPGDVGAAYESLGLVTRSFFSPLLAPVAEALETVAPELIGYFWHGVGRAIYFLPVNFVPAGDPIWRPFEMARRSAPTPEVERDLFAGLGWAITMVDIRQPEIVARLLVGRHAAELARTDAFSYGVATSLAMRRDTTPGSRLVNDFLRYRPRGAGAGPWEELVVRPSERVLEHVYPALREERRLGELFRYRPGVIDGGGTTGEGAS